jgi:hypothetical protein
MRALYRMAARTYLTNLLRGFDIARPPGISRFFPVIEPSLGIERLDETLVVMATRAVHMAVT